MGTPISRSATYSGTGAQEWIPLNRWSLDDYTVSLDFASTGTVTVEGTIAKLNQGETAFPFDITGLIAITTSGGFVIQETPLEAIRLNIAANATGINFQVMQQGTSQ